MIFLPSSSGAIRGVPRCDLGAFQPSSMGWKTISTASLPSKVTTGTTLSYQRESVGKPVVGLPSSSTLEAGVVDLRGEPVQREAVAVALVGRHGVDGLVLEDEVAQRVEDRPPVVDFDAAQLVRPVDDEGGGHRRR